MTSVGTNRNTGAVLTGWDHVAQSIQVILQTPIGSRVMRRDFGSNVPDLIDRPQNLDTILDFYVATAEAIDRWEPRFRVREMSINADTPGIVELSVSGLYFPRGHLDDFAQVETVSGRLLIRP